MKSAASGNERTESRGEANTASLPCSCTDERPARTPRGDDERLDVQRLRSRRPAHKQVHVALRNLRRGYMRTTAVLSDIRDGKTVGVMTRHNTMMYVLST